MLKGLRRLAVMMGCSVFLVGGLQAIDDSLGPIQQIRAAEPQDQGDAKAESTRGTKKKTDGDALTGRLPNNFGQLGLSDEQRDKIYAVQAKHRSQIDELERQLRELRETQNREISKVLTKPQRDNLKKLREETRSRRQTAEDSTPAPSP